MLDIVTTAFDQHVVWFIELWLKVLDIVTTAFDQHVVWFIELSLKVLDIVTTALILSPQPSINM